ncbi:MAG: ABC transporter ATP-binding protein/permease [Lachnospiraceae bacterium]|nr:ABC transporter ATP-binding protein/permease [Lachnospiraceae bacterium]
MPRPKPHAPITKEQREASMGALGRIMKELFSTYPIQLIFVFISIIISVLANVQGTMFMQTLIDDYITPMVKAGLGADTDFTPLLHAIQRVLIFYAIGIAATYAYNLIMVYVSQGMLRRLRDKMFVHMEDLPISYFDTHQHGDIMSVYTNDIDTLRQMIGQSIPQLFNSLITIVSVLISMLRLNLVLTAVTLAMVAVMLVVTKNLAGLSGKYFVEQQADIGKLNGNIEEMMNGQKVVKVFNHEDEAIEEFDKLNEKLFESGSKANTYANVLMPANAQIGNISYVIVTVIGGAMALSGFTGLTLGKLASFLTFNKSFNMPINQISQQFNFIVMAMAGATRVYELIDSEKELDDGYVTLVNAKYVDKDGNKVNEEDAIKGGVIEADAEGNIKKGCENNAYRLVETEERTGIWAWKHFHKAYGTTTYQRLTGDVVYYDVDFGYTPEKTVLHNITIDAKAGQKIAFVGATGAGKTTITNLLNRFYDIQDGKIRYDAINVNKIKKADLRRSLGIVLQDTHLFTGTVAENIRYGRLDATDDEVMAAAKLANAHGFIKRLPDGYDTMLTGDGENLSQGQRQLLAIARAAIADPPVLILDEATSSIDTRTEKIIQDSMDRLMKGRTTFVIAHRLSTIRNSDVIMVMDRGRIIEQGNHEELIGKGGKYYQLYTGKIVNA